LIRRFRAFRKFLFGSNTGFSGRKAGTGSEHQSGGYGGKKILHNLFIGVSKTKNKGYAETMKYTFWVMVFAVFFCICTGCKAGGKTASFPEETFGKEASYALGMNVGTSLKTDNLYPNMEEFVQGIKDVLGDSTPRYTIEEAYQIFSEALRSLAEQRNEESKQAENNFLAENSKKPGITVTGSGLQYEVMSEGYGPKPAASDTVRVHYEGSLTNGTVFDSSYSRGEPIEFPLNGVIPGWTEGLQLMAVGSKYRLIIPSDLGYGPQGAGQQIPPYSTLVFEVELLGIVQ
jgi:FKBP-type peptidyl-prolyl cis-trans isomerase